MTGLKLGRLPDRAAVKISFTASPELKAVLQDYAEIYRRAYGQKEGVPDLIPFMLEAFINADPSFKRARRELEGSRAPSPPTQAKDK